MCTSLIRSPMLCYDEVMSKICITTLALFISAASWLLIDFFLLYYHANVSPLSGIWAIYLTAAASADLLGWLTSSPSPTLGIICEGIAALGTWQLRFHVCHTFAIERQKDTEGMITSWNIFSWALRLKILGRKSRDQRFSPRHRTLVFDSLSRRKPICAKNCNTFRRSARRFTLSLSQGIS